MAIMSGPETDVSATVDKLCAALQSGFRIKADEMIHGEIAAVIKNLNSLIIEDEVTPLLLPFLQRMSLIFASHAFSSKVALARHDFEKELAKQAVAHKDAAGKQQNRPLT